MSSTNKTSLGLNMWEGSDKPVRQDFVNDNVIIDEKMFQLNSKNVIVDERIAELSDDLAKLTANPTNVTYTLLDQTLYSITTLLVTKHNGWCRVHCHVTPTATGSATVVALASGLPIPIATPSSWTPLCNNAAGASIGMNVNGSGVLIARYGIINGIYQANFMYPYAQ